MTHLKPPKSKPGRRGTGRGSVFKRSPTGPWIVAWYDHTRQRRQESTHTTDKRAAELILAKKLADVALRSGGVIDARLDRFSQENRKPIDTHLADYIDHCRHVGQAPRHVDQKAVHLRKLREAADATRLQDFTADALEYHMRNMKARGLSARSANFARQIAVAFMAWAVDTRRIDSNPLSVVHKLDEARDRRRERRALTDDELARLLSTAGERGRQLWYMLAALAGLRKGDLQRLRWSDIDLDAGTLTIDQGKAKRTDVLSLRHELIDELRSAMPSPRPAKDAKVFSATVTDATRIRDFLRAGIIRREIVTDAAGQPVVIGKGKRQRPKTQIINEDADGRVADLHALRTTLGTNLARAGVAPQLAQKIMRHSDYKTTLKHYTVIGLADTAAAIASLPPIATITEPAKAAPGIVENSAGEEKSKKSSLATASHTAARASRNNAKPLQQIANNCPDGVSAQRSAEVGKSPTYCEQLHLSAMMNEDICGRNSMAECQPSKLQARHENSLENSDFHTSPGTASHSAATEKDDRKNGQGDRVDHIDVDAEPGNIPIWLRREMAEHFRKLAAMTPKRRAAILALTDD